MLSELSNEVSSEVSSEIARIRLRKRARGGKKVSSGRRNVGGVREGDVPVSNIYSPTALNVVRPEPPARARVETIPNL